MKTSNRNENVLLVDLMQLRKESVNLKMGQKKLPKLKHTVKKEHPRTVGCETTGNGVTRVIGIPKEEVVFEEIIEFSNVSDKSPFQEAEREHQAELNKQAKTNNKTYMYYI